MISPGSQVISRARAAGFTLLEMIIVLVVLGLAMGLALGRGPQHSATLDERALVARVVQTLRQARGAAIATNLPVTVVINPKDKTVAANGLNRIQLPDDMALTAATGLDAAVDAKLTGIRFAPNGSSSGGRIVMVNARRKVSVNVDWLTGRVSVTDAP